MLGIMSLDHPMQMIHEGPLQNKVVNEMYKSLTNLETTINAVATHDTPMDTGPYPDITVPELSDNKRKIHEVAAKEAPVGLAGPSIAPSPAQGLRKIPRRNASVGSLPTASSAVFFSASRHEAAQQEADPGSVPSSPFARLRLDNGSHTAAPPTLDLRPDRITPSPLSGLDAIAAVAAQAAQSDTGHQERSTGRQPLSQQHLDRKIRRHASMPASLNSMVARQDLDTSTTSQLQLQLQAMDAQHALQQQAQQQQQQQGAADDTTAAKEPKQNTAGEGKQNRRLVRRNASMPTSLNTITSRPEGSPPLPSVSEGAPLSLAPQEQAPRRLVRRNVSLPTHLNTITVRNDLMCLPPSLSTVAEGVPMALLSPPSHLVPSLSGLPVMIGSGGFGVPTVPISSDAVPVAVGSAPGGQGLTVQHAMPVGRTGKKPGKRKGLRRNQSADAISAMHAQAMQPLQSGAYPVVAGAASFGVPAVAAVPQMAQPMMNGGPGEQAAGQGMQVGALGIPKGHRRIASADGGNRVEGQMFGAHTLASLSGHAVTTKSQTQGSPPLSDARVSTPAQSQDRPGPSSVGQSIAAQAPNGQGGEVVCGPCTVNAGKEAEKEKASKAKPAGIVMECKHAGCSAKLIITGKEKRIEGSHNHMLCQRNCWTCRNFVDVFMNSKVPYQ